MRGLATAFDQPAVRLNSRQGGRACLNLVRWTGQQIETRKDFSKTRSNARQLSWWGYSINLFQSPYRQAHFEIAPVKYNNNNPFSAAYYVLPVRNSKVNMKVVLVNGGVISGVGKGMCHHR